MNYLNVIPRHSLVNIHSYLFHLVAARDVPDAAGALTLLLSSGGSCSEKRACDKRNDDGTSEHDEDEVSEDWLRDLEQVGRLRVIQLLYWDAKKALLICLHGCAHCTTG